MRDKHNGNVDLAPDLHQVVLHFCAGLSIQRAKGLIHQQHTGGRGKGARNGHTLLHTARKLVWKCRCKLFQPDHLEPLHGLPLGFQPVNAPHLDPEHDVATHIKPREQRVFLKDHSPVRPRTTHRFAVHKNLPACGVLQTGKNTHQSGLATARWPNHTDKLAPVDAKLYGVKGDSPVLFLGKDLGNTVNFQNIITLFYLRHSCGHVWWQNTIVRERMLYMISHQPFSLFHVNSLPPITPRTISVPRPTMPIRAMAAKTLSKCW